jgi:hypothetical protein
VSTEKELEIEQGEKKQQKKPYEPPVLVQWGSLREITQKNGWNGNSDGGKGKQQRRTR